MQNWMTIFGCCLPSVFETSFCLNYTGDFEKAGGVSVFVATFALPRSFAILNKLAYQKYNWGLNDRGSVSANDAHDRCLGSDIEDWFLGAGQCYTVNAFLFGSICVGPIPFFPLSIMRLVCNLQRGRAAVASLLSAACFFVSAYLYRLVASQNIPGWVYIFIAGMPELDVCATVCKVRSQIGGEPT